MLNRVHDYKNWRIILIIMASEMILTLFAIFCWENIVTVHIFVLLRSTHPLTIL